MCVFALACASLFGQSTPVIPAQQTRTSGMIGLTEGQLIRLNVLNPGVTPPAVGVVCSAALKFWDGQGALLKSTTVSVDPGKNSYFDLFGGQDLALLGDDRREIRATITIPPILPPAASTVPTPAPCTLIGTVELIDIGSGRTQEVIGVGHVVP
jgi:hypothetical protein